MNAMDAFPAPWYFPQGFADKHKGAKPPLWPGARRTDGLPPPVSAFGEFLAPRDPPVDDVDWVAWAGVSLVGQGFMPEAFLEPWGTASLCPSHPIA